MVSLTGTTEAVAALIPVGVTVAIASKAFSMFGQPVKKAKSKSFSWL